MVVICGKQEHDNKESTRFCSGSNDTLRQRFNPLDTEETKDLLPLNNLSKLIAGFQVIPGWLKVTPRGDFIQKNLLDPLNVLVNPEVLAHIVPAAFA